MIAGREIDRIESTQRGVSGENLVRYRRRIWPVDNGCIHVDSLPAMPMLSHGRSHNPAGLSLAESPLPTRLIDCTVLLRSEFPALGDAAILSIATLAQVGLELLARETLLDFLDILDPSNQFANDDSSQGPIRAKGLEIDLSAFSSDAKESDEWDVDWLPQKAWEAPEQDDSELRDLANDAQTQIGAHAVHTSDVGAIDFGGLTGDDDWLIETPNSTSPISTTREGTTSGLSAASAISASGAVLPSPRTASLPAQHLSFIVEQTLLLNETSLEVLRYFMDNPGDNSSHAESVTGCSRGMINGLLNGTLSRYVEKTRSGGWSCYAWVPDVMAAIDDRQ
ncbi:hypothetical protein CSV86_004605 [Pseudomonas putida CSV86]|uniref:Uncharacterized protein n=1 Tax=Pseudomonas bharatica CSV86 TaxID=1005395 RepID=A0A7K4EA90_9PSED|nr:hypothetical protein [Pseudomonas bharatica]NNJ14575.1 hypothetical protein [Pseudomonas bharatica CSV86]